MTGVIKVSLIQHEKKDNVEKTISYVIEEIKKESQKGANIICLQELFAWPYFCSKMDPDNFNYAITDDNLLINKFQQIALENKIVLVFPYFEKRMEGVYHNTALVIDSNGTIVGKYRKMHIPDDPFFYEKYYFSEGDLGYNIFNTAYGKISVLICWDQWFPEAARIVALQGADVIFYPTAIGVLEGEEKLRAKFEEAWQIMGRSSAIANGIYVAMVNRVGMEGDIEFWGKSFVCDPFGEIMVCAGSDQETISAEINQKTIYETRTTWPFFRDRRIDSYQQILHKCIGDN